MVEPFYLKIVSTNRSVIISFRKLTHYFNQIKIEKSFPKIGFEEIFDGYLLIYESYDYFTEISVKDIDQIKKLNSLNVEQKVIENLSTIPENGFSIDFSWTLDKDNEIYSCLNTYFTNISSLYKLTKIGNMGLRLFCPNKELFIRLISDFFVRFLSEDEN